MPSLKSVKKAIKSDLLYLNNHKAATSNWIKEGDVIELYDKEEKLPKPYKIKLEVVYEDDYLAVINKPAGISVSGNQFRTIENALFNNLSISEVEGVLKRARPVHRLDNPTRGLLLVSKTINVHVKLGKLFEQKKIQKVYHAIVMGEIAEKGNIEKDIDGLSAHTEYERVKIVPSIKSRKLSLVRLFPKTGRTHQLRIHLSSIGYPILGDQQYGIPGNILLRDGLYLCATELTFEHPVLKKEMNLKIPIPNKFQKRMQYEKRLWSGKRNS